MEEKGGNVINHTFTQMDRFQSSCSLYFGPYASSESVMLPLMLAEKKLLQPQIFLFLKFIFDHVCYTVFQTLVFCTPAGRTCPHQSSV